MTFPPKDRNLENEKSRNYHMYIVVSARKRFSRERTYYIGLCKLNRRDKIHRTLFGECFRVASSTSEVDKRNARYKITVPFTEQIFRGFFVFLSPITQFRRSTLFSWFGVSIVPTVMSSSISANTDTVMCIARRVFQVSYVHGSTTQNGLRF